MQLNSFLFGASLPPAADHRGSRTPYPSLLRQKQFIKKIKCISNSQYFKQPPTYIKIAYKKNLKENSVFKKTRLKHPAHAKRPQIIKSQMSDEKGFYYFFAWQLKIGVSMQTKNTGSSCATLHSKEDVFSFFKHTLVAIFS